VQKRFTTCQRHFAMQTFKQELETILFQLRNSAWANHREVQRVITEYEHLVNAAKTSNQQRRVSLQIFHASRAIDSLLKHMVEHEAQRAGRAITGYLNLKRSLNNIQRHCVAGQKFTPTTETDINDLTKARNLYLHVADNFPSDADVRVFLNQTIRAIGEAKAFPT
jgi:hypothetical protein